MKKLLTFSLLLSAMVLMAASCSSLAAKSQPAVPVDNGPSTFSVTQPPAVTPPSIPPVPPVPTVSPTPNVATSTPVGAVATSSAPTVGTVPTPPSVPPVPPVTPPTPNQSSPAAGTGSASNQGSSPASGPIAPPTPAPTSIPPVSKASISIQNFAFNPAQLTIDVGTTVTWTNNDSVGHQIASNSFNSSLLSKGDTFSQTFKTAGTFPYHCAIHPSMTGTIIVK
jgi:plastocyanin